MTQGTHGKVPIPTLERLATYLRFLIDLEQSHVDTISSAEVERQTGVNAAQFRKDLSWFGEFGKPGVGYNVQDLQARITRILKIDREQRIILVGAGNLGSALVGYPGLQEHHFNLVAVFDNNYGKIGRPLWNLEIMDVQRIKEVNSVLGARIAILAVPAGAAQKVADLLVEAGIHAILNFAPVLLRKPDNVFVRNVSFLQELAVLSYHLSGDLIPGDLLSGLTGSLLEPGHEPVCETDDEAPEETHGLSDLTGATGNTPVDPHLPVETRIEPLSAPKTDTEVPLNGHVTKNHSVEARSSLLEGNPDRHADEGVTPSHQQEASTDQPARETETAVTPVTVQ